MNLAMLLLLTLQTQLMDMSAQTGIPLCSAGKPYVACFVDYAGKPEPMDIPAVEVKVAPKGECILKDYRPEGGLVTRLGDGRESLHLAWNGHFVDDDHTRNLPRCEPKTVASCADKSRVLLTSEDGVRHCVKF